MNICISRGCILTRIRLFFLVRPSSHLYTAHLFILEWFVPILSYTAHLEKPGTTQHAHKEYNNNFEGPPLLVSANTVPRFLTGGAGAKLLLGSEVRLG